MTAHTHKADRPSYPLFRCLTGVVHDLLNPAQAAGTAPANARSFYAAPHRLPRTPHTLHSYLHTVYTIRHAKPHTRIDHNGPYSPRASYELTLILGQAWNGERRPSHDGMCNQGQRPEQYSACLRAQPRAHLRKRPRHTPPPTRATTATTHQPGPAPATLPRTRPGRQTQCVAVASPNRARDIQCCLYPAVN